MSVEDEAAILRNAPKYPLEVSRHSRCHICGQIEPGELVAYDTHISGLERYACATCNPNRGQW